MIDAPLNRERFEAYVEHQPAPGPNPGERAFSKIEAHLRAAEARTYDALWRRIGNICDLFQPEERRNFCPSAGYVHG